MSDCHWSARTVLEGGRMTDQMLAWIPWVTATVVALLYLWMTPKRLASLLWGVLVSFAAAAVLTIAAVHWYLRPVILARQTKPVTHMVSRNEIAGQHVKSRKLAAAESLIF